MVEKDYKLNCKLCNNSQSINYFCYNYYYSV